MILYSEEKDKERRINKNLNDILGFNINQINKEVKGIKENIEKSEKEMIAKLEKQEKEMKGKLETLDKLINFLITIDFNGKTLLHYVAEKIQKR